MELFETEIGGKKFSCYALSVTQAGPFEASCKRLFLDNLEKASGVDVSVFFGGDGETNKNGLSLFEAITTYIKDIEFEAFYAFHIDCLEKCFIRDATKESGVRAVNVDGDLKRPENYQLFSWYVECQIGPFTEWLRPHYLKAKVYAKGVMSALEASAPISTDSTTAPLSSETSA